jgi:exopolysaccharide production protein ExoZ
MFVLPIQYLRAIASLMVVLYHATRNFYGSYPDFPNRAWLYNFQAGSAGIDIFFVISGFIMAKLSTERDEGPVNFLVHRLIRVFPLYWLAVIAVLPYVPADRLTLDATVRSLFLIQWTDGHTFFPLFVPGWTLAYEVFFYLLVSATLLLPRQFRSAVILLALFLVAMTYAHPKVGLGLRYFSNLRLLEFAAGYLLYQHHAKITLESWRAGLLVAVGFFTIFIMFYNGEANPFINWGVPSVLVVLGALKLNLSSQRLPWRVMGVLGDASYSIYLSHLFVLSGILAFGISITTWRGFIVYLAVSLVACAVAGVVIHKLVELPMLGFLRRLLTRPAAKVVATG